MATATYKVGVAQYYRDEDYTIPCHWAIMLLVDENETWFYQIVGTPDNYALAPPKKSSDISMSGTFRGALKVGEIKASEKARFEEIISNVTIYHNRPGWNCQSWVVSVIQQLQMAGLLPAGTGYSQQALLNDLLRVLEDWENMVPTFGERGGPV